MTLEELPNEDCHFQHRKAIIRSERLKSETLCVSLAWDWNFLGFSERGIYREVTATLESTVLNRLRGARSLAIPEFSVLEAARHFAKPISHTTTTSFLPSSNLDVPQQNPRRVLPSERDHTTVCRGILPVLRYIVTEHADAIERARKDQRGKPMKLPDTYANPYTTSIDPRGNDGFHCMTCRKELSNVYYHCDGCEKLLSKDYNICVACHVVGQFRRFTPMHPHNQKRRHATINHTGR